MLFLLILKSCLCAILCVMSFAMLSSSWIVFRMVAVVVVVAGMLGIVEQIRGRVRLYQGSEV